MALSADLHLKTGQSGATSLKVHEQLPVAGWSSPVARRAHNPKVVGSNPAPATNFSYSVLILQ